MTSERIKEIQETTAYPESVSVKQALLQVWNECEQKRVKNSSMPNVSAGDIKSFITWKDIQNKDYLGGKFMYNIKGYYKCLDESELFDYWLERVHSR